MAWYSSETVETAMSYSGSKPSVVGSTCFSSSYPSSLSALNSTTTEPGLFATGRPPV